MPINYEVQRVRVNPDANTVIVTGSTILDIQNVGSGEGVYKGLSGTTAQFKTLLAGEGMSLSGGTDEIVITNTVNTSTFVQNDTFTGYTATTETRLEGIEDDITGNTANISQLRIDVDNISGQTTGNTVNILTLSGDVEQNKTDIQIVSGATVSNLNLITGNTANISELRIDVDAISGDTITNANSITGNTLLINNNATGITANYELITGNTAALEGKVDLTGDTMTGFISVPELVLQTGATVTGHTTGSMHWNGFDGTADFHLKHGANLQAGMESLIYGWAAEDLVDGDVVRIIGFTAGGAPYFYKTVADSSLTGNDVGVVTTPALAGTQLYVTVFGKVRGLSTTGWTSPTLWLSNTVRGLLIDVEPVYPDVKIPIAFVAKTGTTDGEIIVNPSLDNSPILNNLQYTDDFFIGTFVDKIAMEVYETGGTVYITVEKDVNSGSTDFRVLVGTDAIETFSAQTIALIAGTDEVPVLNYVSMEADGIHVNTGYFTGNALDTDGAFAAVGTVLVQSTSGVSANNAYKVHGFIDKLVTDTRGDYVKTTERVREENAKWDNGVLQTFLLTPNGGALDRIDMTTTQGIVWQKNRNTMPIMNTIGDVTPIFTANDEVTPYNEVTDLGKLNYLADGTPLTNNDWLSIVVWGVVSQNQADCKLYVNLSTGVYNSTAAASADAFNYTVYTSPEEFRGTSFLISRLVLRYQTTGSGTWTIEEEIDLRGVEIGITGGLITGGASAIAVKNSLEQDVDLIYQLVGDELTPTNGKFYGYSGSTKGFFTPEYTDITGNANEVVFNLSGDTYITDSNLYWDNTNKRLGIGTTSPNKLLSLSKSPSDTTDPQLLITDAGGTANDKHFGILVNGGIAKLVPYDDSFNIRSGIVVDIGTGNVGIGTDTPKEILEVFGAAILRNGFSLSWGNTWSTGSPAILGSTDTLIFYPEGNVSGEAMRIAANNNVGIGTTSPNELLHVNKSVDGDILTEISNPNAGVSARSGIKLSTDLAGGAYIVAAGSNYSGVTGWDSSMILSTDFSYSGGIKLRTSGGKISFQPNGTVDKVVIDTTGYVGIGTSSPTTGLHISSISALGSRLRVTRSGGNPAIQLDSGDNAENLLFWDNGNSGIVIQPSGTSRPFIVKNNGNVGIGTASPDFLLTTNYDGAATFTNVTGDFAQMWQNSAANGLGIALTDNLEASIVTNNNYELVFREGTSERMRIQQGTGNVTIGGNVGIGTTTPDNPLEVIGTIQSSVSDGGENVRLQYNGVFGDRSDFYMGNANASGKLFLKAGNVDHVTILPSGNVGIGEITPVTQLHVAGAITQNELSADPADPAEGSSVQWMSDGTGSGDDGDIMMKITAGGTTKTVTLVDFSAV